MLALISFVCYGQERQFCLATSFPTQCRFVVLASDGYIRGANTESVPINDLVNYHQWKEFLPTSSCPSLCHHGGMAFFSWPAEHVSSHYWVTATVSNYKHVTYMTNVGLPDEGCIIIIDQSANFCIAWHQEEIQRWCGFLYLTWWYKCHKRQSNTYTLMLTLHLPLQFFA